jgi:pentatricopeptide repeat protein
MDFADEITQGAALFESGKLAEAAAIFKRLCEDEKLPGMGRAIAFVNLAVTYDKMGHPDHAVAAHEYGVGAVVGDYVFAQDNRASYLFKIGRVDEAIEIWEHLLDLDFVPQDKADRIRHNLDVAIEKRRKDA